MVNKLISEIFQQIGDILEILDENRFRIISYQRASLTISAYAVDLEEVYNGDVKNLESVPGVGKDLALKIEEIINTGESQTLKKLLTRIPKGLLDMLRLRSIGPKKVKLFYNELGLKTIRELELAAKAGKIQELPRMGAKSESEILKSIEDLTRYSERMLMPYALEEAEEVIEYLKKNKNVKKVQYAGSLRRRKETVGDIDILVTPKTMKKAHEIMDYFVNYMENKKTLANGATKSSIVLTSGMQVDLRVIEEKSFGAAMHYFTGSKAHNIAIRDMAKKKGLKISEYGVFKGEKMIGGKTEEEVFKSVGLPYIIPEFRKNDGEFEAAKNNKLPNPIEYEDIKGDLHMHTIESDGQIKLEDVAEYYFNKSNYEYIAIADHSKSSAIANGLDEKRLLKQIKAIDELNKEYSKKKRKNGLPFKVLKGCEVDIKDKGKLDFSNEILAQLDVFPVSVHSRFTLSSTEQTQRIINAMKNPHVKFVGHPTGRLLNKREPYEVDVKALIEAAIEYKVALELNSQPSRLDLKDTYLKLAKEMGAKIVINTDSHHTNQHAFMKYGVYMARRGWLEKKDVLNAQPLNKLMAYFKK